MGNKLEVNIDQVDDIRVMTTEVVTAYLGRNQLAARDLSGLIVEVFNTLSELGSSEVAEEEDSSDADAGAGEETVAEADPVTEVEQVEEPQPEPEPEPVAVAVADSERPIPAIPIEKSVTDDLIYCLENGKGFKTLKRHLWNSHGLTPEAYRKKWGLPEDYPMVAPNYSARRSATAKKIGLGRRPRGG